jgi:membrane-bound ClpP family serine protease
VADPSGWREPRLRLLRTTAALVLLGLLVWLVIFEPSNDTGAIGTLVGAVLILLGFEGLERIRAGKP